MDQAYIHLIVQIGVGGLLGALGQGIRMIVGLKKWYDDQQANGTDADDFNTGRLVVSLFIGFTAGALGILTLGDFDPTSKQSICTILGIGYAGVDFIEGFITKYLPRNSDTTTAAAASPPVNGVPALPSTGAVPATTGNTNTALPVAEG